MPVYRTTAYRYPNETIVLMASVLLVLAVIIVTATATFCLSGIFVVLMVGLATISSRSAHRQIMQNGYPVTPNRAPELSALARTCQARIQPEPVEIYVTQNSALNAYTFGLDSPKVVVLYSALFNVMDADEISFILGHELGHVALGHTWLNTLVGGMAGIPAPFGAAVFLYAGFMGWNRMCEYSADRAGLLACGKPGKAISALVKLGAGPGQHSADELQRIYQMLNAEDDNVLNQLGETFATHPMIIKRINNLRIYAASGEYQRLQALVNRNIIGL